MTDKRTLEEINLEYNRHAAYCGHKSRLLKELELEIEAHIEAMQKLDQEARHLKSEGESVCPRP